MDGINVRLYHGGVFVTKRSKTSYEGGGLSLRMNEDEVCYFEVVGWIKELGYSEPGRIWFRRRVCSLFSGRTEMKSDKELSAFLDSPETDGSYHLYVVHENSVENEERGVGGSKNKSTTSQTAQNPPNSPEISTKTQHKVLEPVDDDDSDVDLDTDEGDSDVDLSDADYEDKNDDDLFAENVDEEISDRVTRSLSGLGAKNSESALTLFKDTAEFDSVSDDDINVEDDEVLDDSEEELHSPKNSDDDGDDGCKLFNPDVDFKGKIQLLLGMKFPSHRIFRKALQWHAMQEGYDFYFTHNGESRLTAYCRKRCECEWKKGRFVQCTCTSKRKCGFRVHCVKLGGKKTVQIKTMNLKHSCGFQTENSKVTSEYLAERYLDDWRDNPTWKLSAFMLKCRRDLGVEVKYHKCYYARQRAFYMIYGDAAEQYKRVWDYVETVRKYNEGSSACVKVESIERPPPLFQRMYICLQPCKQGFMAGCRPILGVDGCHLRGPFPGMLLTAVGKDGNNNIFPVAWAIVEVENTESWTWFLGLLVKDLGSVADSVTFMHEREEPITYMSDRQKGLVDAFKAVVPNAETRYCCRHIWANFKKQFAGEVYRQQFWKAARASHKSKFNEAMESIKMLNEDAFKYLNAIPAGSWSRHAFSLSSKSGMLLNNCCESFNGVIREARAKPVLTMMEWIRRWVMKRCCQKREGLRKFEGVVMPSVVKMVEKYKEYVRNCDVNQADVWEFEVDFEGDTFVVDLQKRTCGCYRWDLLGIPCCHALACIEKKRMKYEDYIHEAYHVDAYRATYAPAFHAMPGQNQWVKAQQEEPLPPRIRVMPGRPSHKKRRKEPGEGKVAREVKKNKCSNCGNVGHNKKKCKQPTQVKRPKPKGGRPKSTDPVTQNQEKRKNRKRKSTDQGSSQPLQQSQTSQSSCLSINQAS